MRILSDLIGTLAAFFRVAGLRISNDADTTLEVRDKDGSAFRDLRARRLALRRETGTNEVSISLPAEPAASVDYQWPVDDGASSQVLTTDGAGNLTWATVATAENTIRVVQTIAAWDGTSPVAMFTPPAGSTIRKIMVDVETAFDGASPALSVGTAGDPSRFMGTNENEIDAVGIYETAPLDEVGATPDPVVMTFAAGAGATEGLARVSVEYKLPDLVP